MLAATCHACTALHMQGAAAELQWSANKAAWVAIVIACGAGLFAVPLIISIRRYFLEQDNRWALHHGWQAQ